MTKSIPLLISATVLAHIVSAEDCISPGTCTAPNLPFSRVIRGPAPSLQWNINGGFCGAFSLQQAALAFGAWISQDLVRKANAEQDGPHFMHGNSTLGYEVMPSNVAFTAENLKLTYDEWNYTLPAPQADAFKAWLKGHLVRGEPVAFFPMCQGDSHKCYPLSCPGDPKGHMDHVEPIFGIFSNHSLDDTTAYPDDVIVHMSDQDLLPYYRALSTLEDTSAMDGNCADAQPGFGNNEMYPCIDQDVTYGLAVTGLAVDSSSLLPLSASSSSSCFSKAGAGTTTGARAGGGGGASPVLPASLVVDLVAEPDVRQGGSPVPVHGTVEVTGLSAFSSTETDAVFALYRFGATAALPSSWSDLDSSDFEHRTLFTADEGQDAWTFQDPDTFQSDSATYYVATLYSCS